MKKAVLLSVIIVLGTLLFSVYNIATEPVGLYPSQIPSLSGTYDPYGENTSFEMSAPGTNATYFAWIMGPDHPLTLMGDYAVDVNIVKTGQNLSGVFQSSTIKIDSAVYTPSTGQNFTTYSVVSLTYSNNSQMYIDIGFNRIPALNNTSYGTVTIKLTAESTVGPYHILGQTKTLSLIVRFP